MMQLIFSEFQDQLVRGLAHRMNNILSLFHGYLGLLMDDQKLNPVIKEGLTRVRDGACDASELMERINAVTRPASTLPREMEPADLFRQLAPTLQRLQTPNVNLTVECPEGLPSVCVDISRMKLAIVELVRNACEAAYSKVTVRVSVEKGAEQPDLFPGGGSTHEGEQVKIEVIDDGAGIRPSDMSRIYEPFFSTKKKNQIAGLGLAVALGCAQEFGGTLRHRSNKGGATFDLTLPARAQRRLQAVA
jgi:signal transduction histidine kinase